MLYVLNNETARNIKNSRPSAVSSIEIQIFRKDPDAHKAHLKDSNSYSDSDSSRLSSEGTPDLGDAQRAPTFEDYPEWWSLNAFVDEDASPSPPFEVIGVNHRKLTNNNTKNRVLKTWPGDFKLWASVKFLLFSTTDFRTLGFLDTPEYVGTPWSAAKSNYKKPAVKDAPQSSKATPVIDADADDEDNADILLLKAEDDQDEQVKTVKGKEVRSKTVKHMASEGVDTPFRLASSKESAGKFDPVIQNSRSSRILDESHDIEDLSTVSKVIHVEDDSKIIGLSNNQSEELTDTLNSAPSIEIEFPEIDADKRNEIHTNRKKQKQKSIPGIEGGPANQFQNDPTRSERNQRNMVVSNSDDPSTPIADTANQLHTKKDHDVSDLAQLFGLNQPGDLRQSSVPRAVGETQEKEKAARFKSLDLEATGSPWEPMTPPVSSKKQVTKDIEDFGDTKRGLSSEFREVNQTESAARVIVTEDNYSDNSSPEASPTFDFCQKVGNKKAEKIKQRNPGLNFESPIKNQQGVVPSANVDLMDTNFDEFIVTSPLAEDTEMVDSVESEIDAKVRLTTSLSLSPQANLRSSPTIQTQDSVNLASSSKSQNLITSQQGEAGSQTPTQDVSQNLLEEVADIQIDIKTKRYPSSAVPSATPEKLAGSNQREIVVNIEMIESDDDDNGVSAKTVQSEGEQNGAPLDIGNQQDGREDSPSNDEEATIKVAPVKPAKQTRGRTLAAARSSPVPKTQSTPASKQSTSQKTPTAQKTQATKGNKSSIAPDQSEKSQTRTKKAALKVEILSVVADHPEQSPAKPKKPAPKNSKASKVTAPTNVEQARPKGNGRAKAVVGDKRKADQMTSASSSSRSNKTNESPALRQTSVVDRETAAAEARVQAAKEKKKALEEKLQATKDMKLRMEKVSL